MKLSERAKAKINHRPSVLALALALNFTELWVEKLIEANKENGPLTTAKALQVIRAETGFTDSEILEDETVGAIK